MIDVKSELRKDCPMRHENGNCLPCGGFCTAVNDPICEGLHNAYDAGWYAALNAQIEAENTPLTLEELREMDGEPVWAVPMKDEPDWASCWCIINDGCISTGSVKNKNMTHFFYLKDYGVIWLAYRRKKENGLCSATGSR